MSLSLLLIFTAVFLLLVSTMYVPLPSEICDRKKIQIVEFGLRIANEYLGNILELVAGPRVRNKLTRFLCALPFVLFQRSPPKWCIVRNQHIAGVPCRVYLPQGERRKSNAAVIFIHGGGWCIMRPAYYDGPLYSLIARIGCTVISIDYQLSPEARFPTAIEECERVVRTIHDEKHTDFGIDPKRLALLGDSAGGNLCAVLCQRALRAGKSEMIKCQVLLYPVIHCLDMLSPSYQYYYNGYRKAALLHPTMLTRWLLMYVGVNEVTEDAIQAVLNNAHTNHLVKKNEEIKSILDHSLLPTTLLSSSSSTQSLPTSSKTNVRGGKRTRNRRRSTTGNDTQEEKHHEEIRTKLFPLLDNPDLCPIVGKDLQGLSAAMICRVGIDILRDEGVLYARRLQKYGVPVQWNHYEAAFHGILHMPMSKQRKHLLDDIASYLHRALG